MGVCAWLLRRHAVQVTNGHERKEGGQEKGPDP